MRNPGAPPSFAGLRVAIYGRAGKRIASLQPASSATPILPIPRGPAEENLRTANSLAAAIQEKWPSGSAPAKRLVVCTGGEPLLQLDGPLIEALHACNFEIAIETNGTIAAPEHLDWICVSPKAGAPLRQMSGDELKLVYPQAGFDPEDFVGLQFNNFFLQPMDGPQPRRQHGADPAILPQASAVEVESADAQDRRNQVSIRMHLKQTLQLKGYLAKSRWGFISGVSVRAGL